MIGISSESRSPSPRNPDRHRPEYANSLKRLEVNYAYGNQTIKKITRPEHSHLVLPEDQCVQGETQKLLNERALLKEEVAREYDKARRTEVDGLKEGHAAEVARLTAELATAREETERREAAYRDENREVQRLRLSERQALTERDSAKHQAEQSGSMNTALKDSVIELEKQVAEIKRKNLVLSGEIPYDPSGGLTKAVWAVTIPKNAPRVIPTRYTKVQRDELHYHFAIILTNDGQEPAHDVKIEPFTLGGPRGWVVAFQEVYRIARGEEVPSRVDVSGRNVALDLDWAFGQWLGEEMVRDPKTGDFTLPDPLQFGIVYRDHASNWYRSNCEVGRDLQRVGEELYVKFIRQERIEAPGLYSSRPA